MAPSPYRSLLGNNIDGTPLTLMLGRREFSPDRPPSIEHRGAPRRTECRAPSAEEEQGPRSGLWLSTRGNSSAQLRAEHPFK